jgi:hypothetical protein
MPAKAAGRDSHPDEIHGRIGARRVGWTQTGVSAGYDNCPAIRSDERRVFEHHFNVEVALRVSNETIAGVPEKYVGIQIL